MTRPELTRIRSGIHDFGRLTSLEVTVAASRGALLLLPIGATEQHGDGLPLATDTIRAQHVVQQVAAALDGNAFVLPSIGYGVSPHHLGLPGTISVDPLLFIRLITSVVENCVAQGFCKFLVVTGHGGNMAALGVVQQNLLVHHPDVIFSYSPLSALATDTHEHMSVSEVTGHSGESETSQMLAINPEFVDAAHLNPGACTLDELDARARLSRVKSPSTGVRFDRYAENGVLGDPRHASADDGQQVIAEVVAKLTAHARLMLEI